MKVLVLIRGVPGSGKTTLANALWTAAVVDSFVEADDFFMNEWGNYVFDPSKLEEAHQQCQEDAEALMVLGRNLAVSNCFLNEEYVKPYLDLATKYGYNIQEIWMAPFTESEHNVPDSKMVKLRFYWAGALLEKAKKWHKAFSKEYSLLTQKRLLEYQNESQKETKATHSIQITNSV